MAELSYVYHYDFIHNVMSNFFKDTLDYLSYVYPRFEYRLVGTYDKAVAYINSQSATSSEIDKPNLPAIILDPSGDFQLADPNVGGIQHWRFPNLASGMTKRIFNPIYMDEHVRLSPGFSRIKGSMEVVILLNSFYEYTDVRILLMQIFGGFDRWLYPSQFNTFIIMPEDLINYEYSNSVTGETYTVDWASAGAYETLVKTTNRNEWVFPVLIKPIVKMIGLSDGSEKYGGTDGLAEWRLTLELEYELEAPSFMIVETDFIADNLTLNIHVGSEYSSYTWQPPTNRMISHFEWVTGIVPQTHNTHFDLSQESQKVEDIKLVHKIRYFYAYTQADYDSTDNIIIPLEEIINNQVLLILNSRHGKLEYWDHWELDTTNNTLIIKRESVDFTSSELLEINVYRYEDSLLISHRPVITSTPSTTVDIRSSAYIYNVTAYDADVGDTLVFSLDTYPVGMTINPASGYLEWTAGVGDLGFEPVTVRVTDQDGLFDTQSFTLEIIDSNTAPQITSTPDGTIVSELEYVYNATAVDDQTGLIWSIESGPLNLSIDSSSGIVSWITTIDDIGINSVTIRVTDIYGLFDEQTFNIEVLSSNPAPISRWLFNSDGLDVDSVGTNNLTVFGSPVADTTEFIEGDQSVYFPFVSTSGHSLYINDVNLSSDFPFKSDSSSKDFTICFWYRGDPGSQNCTIVCKGFDSILTNQYSWAITINQGSYRLYMDRYNNNGTWQYVQLNQIVDWVEPNKWYHISVAVNAESNTVFSRIYNQTDNVQLTDKTSTFPIGDFIDSDGSFGIGGRMRFDETWGNHGLGVNDPARLDDMWIFDQILTNTQIDEIRNGTYSW